MIITMDGKYAYRRNPREQVRVLCVDKTSGNPVIVLGPDRSDYTLHGADGSVCSGGGREGPGYHLVPLDESFIVTLGLYRMRGGGLATVCYIRSGPEFEGYLAVGWDDAKHVAGATAWLLSGRFIDAEHLHSLDLVERIGDLP